MTGQNCTHTVLQAVCHPLTLTAIPRVFEA